MAMTKPLQRSDREKASAMIHVLLIDLVQLRCMFCFTHLQGVIKTDK